MTRKTKEKPICAALPITDIAAEGNAIARLNEKVIFVPFAVPGDVADIQIIRNKKNYCEGRVVAFQQLSPTRCQPRCPHFGICGGCKWQMLPYEQQLKFKQQQVEDNLTRLAKLTLPPIQSIIGSDKIYEYRNKLEFAFADRQWIPTQQVIDAGGINNIEPQNALGFHVPKHFDKILDITQCHLMEPINDRIRNHIRTTARQKNFTFYNEKTHQGLLRNMIIRANTSGQVMLIIVFAEPWKENPTLQTQITQWLGEMLQQFPEIVSMQYAINTKLNDSLDGITTHTFAGSDHLVQTMENLRFRIAPKSFYQTNSTQALKLYQVVEKFAALNGTETVYDLYTGTGTIALFLARCAKKVIGIEYVQDAVNDANINMQDNQLSNLQFFAGDMKDVLNSDFIEQYGKPDIVITDPPRTGMHQSVIDTLLNIGANKIIYVSCNPATQARDLAELTKHYHINAVQPVDMFPHTHHIENVVLLTK